MTRAQHVKDGLKLHVSACFSRVCLRESGTDIDEQSDIQGSFRGGKLSILKPNWGSRGPPVQFSRG